MTLAASRVKVTENFNQAVMLPQMVVNVLCIRFTLRCKHLGPGYNNNN